MITVIGLDASGRTSPEAAAALARAELLLGGTRHLEQLPDAPGERFDYTGRMSEVRPMLQRNMDREIVVLASGDPMFFGMGTFLARHFRPPQLRVLPAPTLFSEAFARVGLGWEDAALLSAHGRPMPDVAAALDRHGKVAVFTDDTNSPAAIGALLGPREGQAWVCERLGADDERIQQVEIADLHAVTCAPLNVLLLVGPKRPRPTTPFTPDDRFEKKMPRKGLITKREVRALSMAALGVCPGDTCWDIGAGSGACAIDMAQLGASAVYAVEKNEDGCAIIRENLTNMGAPQVRVVHARAPEGLADLPDPDRVFIGGTGGDMAGLIRLVLGRLRPGGALVCNTATLENLAECIGALKAAGARWELTQVQISRGAPILDLTRLEAQNPIFITAAWPGEAP